MALVTGGAGGIGRAIVSALAADGHRVVAGDIADGTPEESALAVHLDVTDGDSVDVAVARAERELGPIEILVNTAGWDEFHPFLETEEDFWDRIIELNYKGCLRVCRRVVPGMVSARVRPRRQHLLGRRPRRLVLGSRLRGSQGRSGGIRKDARPRGRPPRRHGQLRVPGADGDAAARGLLGAGEASAKRVDALRRAVPMRRLGRPEDVAAAVAFLASDAAGYITGQTLSVSGGLTMA